MEYADNNSTQFPRQYSISLLQLDLIYIFIP